MDAGTGSLILQAVGGAVITVLVFIKSFGQRIRSFFTFRKVDKEPSDAAE